MADLCAAAQRHVEAFNDAVRSASFDEFSTRFAHDAVMRFVGVPVGPYKGRGSILEAYRTQPPDDVMSLEEIVEIGDGVRARFRWGAGGAGTMWLSFRGELVRELVVEFDHTEPP